MTGFPNPILFATDFSGRCDRPLERALGLARHWQSKLVLLHVLEPPHTELTDEERDVEEARITNKLRAQGEGSGVDIEPRIANGPVAATIASVAEELDDFVHFLHVPADVRDRIDFHLDYGETAPVISGLVRSVEADLAVIGTHGKSGFVAATIGNNAKVLLESLTCDVMLVPKEAL